MNIHNTKILHFYSKRKERKWRLKKIISVLTTTVILATSLPMQVFAEDTSEPVKNGDRWAFRQAYVDMTRIVNNDGSYSFPKMELTEKIDVYEFLHNLLNLETISDGSGIPGYPGQLTLYQQPMFSIIEALAILDNEELDFNNPI